MNEWIKVMSQRVTLMLDETSVVKRATDFEKKKREEKKREGFRSLRRCFGCR